MTTSITNAAKALRKKIKNIFDSFVKKKFYSIGINIERNVKKKQLLNFIGKFKENYVSTDLIRIGGKGDGGYLVPKIIDKMKYCFSAGVGDLADFEKDLSRKYNIKSFMADASVNSPPYEDKNFNFIKKYLSSSTNEKFITLGDWLNENKQKENQNIMLQMDIEGSEYEVLTFETEVILGKFSIMVIEFHKFQNLCNPIFLKIIDAIFEKIYKNFYICHVHPNNFSGLYNFKGISIPSCLEITFVRKDLLHLCKLNQPFTLPHTLDRDNDLKVSNLVMPEIWWKK